MEVRKSCVSSKHITHALNILTTFEITFLKMFENLILRSLGQRADKNGVEDMDSWCIDEVL